MTRKKGFVFGVWICSGAVVLLLASAAGSLAETKKAAPKTPKPTAKSACPAPECKKHESAQTGRPLKVLRSAVQRELDALFAKRGYKAPEMTVQAAVKGLPKPEELGAVIGAVRPVEKSKPAGLRLTAPFSKLRQRLIGRARRTHTAPDTAAPALEPTPKSAARPFPGIELTKGEQPDRAKSKPAGNRAKKTQSKKQPARPRAKSTAKPLPLPVPEPKAAAAAAQPDKKVTHAVAKQPAKKTAKSPTPALRPLTKQQVQSMYQKIAERRDRAGLKGFCPVALRDRRELVDAKKQFASIFHGKTYYFSSMEAKARFDANPKRYAPAADGCDVVLLSQTGEKREGSLDNAVWFRGRLYLFCSKLTRERFEVEPTKYAVD